MASLPPPPPPPPPPKKRNILPIVIVLIILILIPILAVWLLYFGGLEMLGLTTTVNVDEILSKSDQALKNIETYRFSSIINSVVKTGGVTTSLSLNGNGVVDLKHKKMRVEYTLQGMKQISYVIGNTMYIKLYGEWYKTSHPNLWKTEELIKSSLDLTSKLKKEYKGIEKINGRDAYKIEISSEGMSEKELTEVMLNITRKIMGYMAMGNITIKKFSGILWIDKETYFLLKSTSHLEMNINTKQGATDISVDTEYSVYDFNKPVNIRLPPEAKNAKPLEYAAPSL